MLSRSAKAVMTITGSPGLRSLIWRSSSSPSPPGMRMSDTSTDGTSAASACRTSAAREKLRVAMPARARAFSSTQRIAWSSSTIQTGFIKVGAPSVIPTGIRCAAHGTRIR
ncbi:Uncharacterised protein [Bordetella pertussis]|nr:Uncharacterised protein [Bordetella pertussis]CFW34004.1 Uncharacterised protein [Bordetella pertussis]